MKRSALIKIEIPVTTCAKCPFFERRNPYSSDGWDLMEDWHCTKEDRLIRGAVDKWEDEKIEIPQWCPFLIPT